MLFRLIGNYNIVFGVLGFILGIYILLCPRNKHANRFLASLVFAFSYTIVYLGLEMKDIVGRFHWIQRTDDPIPFVFGPLMYLYVRTLVRERLPSLRYDYPHFIPFILYTLYLIPWFLSDPLTRPTAEDIPIERPLVTLSKLISVTCYAIGIIFVYRRHEKRIKDVFSGIDKISISWLKASGLIFIGIIGVALIMFLLQGAGMQINDYIDPVIYTLATFWILTVGVFSILQPEMPNRQSMAWDTVGPEVPADVSGEAPVKYRKTSLDEETCGIYLEKLLRHMREKRPYLVSELTIGELAEQISIPAYHISQVINSKLNKNFYDFINEFRVEEAKRLLLDPSSQNLKILAIAYDSGFNSKSTFNFVFKRLTGLTPSTFRLRNMSE